MTKKTKPAATPVPPSAPVPLTDYQQGMMDALRIMKEAREDFDAPLRQVRDVVGAAYVVLNGASHSVAHVVSQAESKIMRHLIAMDSPKKPEDI
jgi:hypothetical protein